VPISSGIIDSALHPPLGLLTNVLDANSPYSGDATITTWSDGGTIRAVGDTFGVIVIVSSLIPTPLGYTIGAGLGGGSIFEGTEYDLRLWQLVVQHQLALGLGGWVTTQLFDSHQLAAIVVWQEAIPGRLGLFVLPGLAVDLQFLRAV
jgi:hypothetical protein